jgi:hypothetical protein
MLRCNMGGAHDMGAARSLDVSKQLSVSAAFSIFAMAAFVLFAPQAPRQTETGTTTFAAAPAFKASLPGF